MSADNPRRGSRRRCVRLWWEVWLPLLLAGLALVGLNLVLYLKLAPAGL